MKIELVLEIFITLMIMIDPPGVIAPYLSLTSKMNEVEKKVVLYQATLFSGLLLIGSIFLGHSILNLLGISTFALQIAGGILIFKFGYEIMNDKMREVDADESPGLFPIGFPLIAGPGSITAIIVITSSKEIISTKVIDVLIVSIIVLVVLFFTFIFLKYGSQIMDKLGKKASSTIIKLNALLILTIGIQMILTGINQWIYLTFYL
ncbi:MAG: MarC family protein [Candidatus Heimdallarchaeota archaeon]|nr:MarC family protein [Candidatus Heimdallarchaeota archaeon]MDH5645704.1 MarC family protein [Candidatus Heimdallarchaeota archaeon]